MKKIIKVVLIFSVCWLTAAVIAFTSTAKVSAAEYDQQYQDAIEDLSMIANLMIHNLNNTDKHYLIISDNYFNVFDSLEIWADAVGWYVPGQRLYESFDELNDNFIEYYETADVFAQENNIDFGIFNVTGELRIFEYVGGGGYLPPINEIPDLIVIPNGIYNLGGYFGLQPTTSTAVNQYYQKLESNVLQKYLELIQDYAYDAGFQLGYDEGYSLGEMGGYDLGYFEGYEDAINLAQEDILEAYNSGYSAGRSAGYREGYRAGQTQEINTSWLTAAVSSITQVLNIQVFGSITIAMLVFFPLLVSLIFFILRLISGRG